MTNGVSTEYLYRHYNSAGALLYVGVSNDVDRRLVQHRRDSRWASDIDKVAVETFPTREDALTAERLAIETEKPLHNTTYSFPMADYHDLHQGMTAASFKAIRHRLRLTQAQLACVLKYDTALTISTYERATNPRPIPAHVALLMVAYNEGYRPSDWPK